MFRPHKFDVSSYTSVIDRPWRDVNVFRNAAPSTSSRATFIESLRDKFCARGIPSYIEMCQQLQRERFRLLRSLFQQVII
jgi:hypothetical protein